MINRLVKLGSGSSSTVKESKDENNIIENMDLVNSRDIHIAEIEQQLQNWSIPKVPVKQIYETGFKFSELFSHDYIIETTEKSLPVNPQVEQLELIDINRMKRLMSKFRFMHIGLVQIAIKPLHRIGLDSPILMCLRDARFTSFTDSLLAICESNLTTGPVYFNCYPNFSVDLMDPNLKKTLTLQMKVPTTMIAESKNVAIIYRVHYKVMKSNLSPRAKIESGRETTILIEANYDHTNVHTPKLIQWDQVSFPDTWVMNNVVPMKPIRPRTQPLEIIENEHGSAEIIFQERSRFSSTRRSTSSVSESVINRQPSMRGVDWNHTVPRALYEMESNSGDKKVSPTMSPTQSEMMQSVSSGIRRQL